MCPHGITRCRHLSNDIEPSIYDGSAPYVKLLSPLVIFGHTHLDTCTDSPALRVEYCIVFHTIRPSSFSFLHIYFVEAVVEVFLVETQYIVPTVRNGCTEV